MSVAQAQREISAREFGEWVAYDRIEPFGEVRADLRSGIVASVIANANSSRHTFRASEFMPRFEPPKPQTDEEQIQIVDAFLRKK